MFDWHALDRDDILHWIIPHLMAGQNSKIFQRVSDSTNGFRNVELKMVINGHEFDGEKALRTLYDALDSSFDRAVAKKVEELTQFTDIQDLLTDILQDAQRRVGDRMEKLGYPAVIDD